MSFQVFRAFEGPCAMRTYVGNSTASSALDRRLKAARFRLQHLGGDVGLELEKGARRAATNWGHGD